MSIKKRQSGFTLTEALVYIAILSVLILTIVSFVFWSVRLGSKSRARRVVLDSAKRAMETMVREVRVADGLYTSATTSNQLSLKTKEYLPDGETVTYIDFYLCDERLCLKKESQLPIALTSDRTEITSLTFSQVGTDFLSIQIDLRMGYKNPSGRLEHQASIHLTSTVSLRSY